MTYRLNSWRWSLFTRSQAFKLELYLHLERFFLVVILAMRMRKKLRAKGSANPNNLQYKNYHLQGGTRPESRDRDDHRERVAKKVSHELTNPTQSANGPKRRYRTALTIGMVTVGFPFLWKIATVVLLFTDGGGALEGVFFKVTVALNILCCVCLLIMYLSDLGDIYVENKLIREERIRKNDEQKKEYRKKQIGRQAKTKWIALVASIVNTLSSVAIAAILYTQERTVTNILMIVFSIVTILFDVYGLYGIYKFYKNNLEQLGETKLGRKIQQRKPKTKGKELVDKSPALKSLAPAAQTVAQTALKIATSVK